MHGSIASYGYYNIRQWRSGCYEKATFARVRGGMQVELTIRKRPLRHAAKGF
jgi:hypothetical protein